SAEDFLSWGWRVPFLISLVLAGVGMYIRLKASETPAFQRAHTSVRRSANPLTSVLRQNPKELMLAIFARFADGGNFYILTVFLLAYAADRAGTSRQHSLECLMVAATLNIIAIPFCGHLSDRFGRRPVFIAGAVFMALWAWPLFAMIDTRDTFMFGLGLAVMMVVGHAPVYATLASYYAELFPASVRCSGISIGYQSAGIILGGLMPLIASTLLLWTDGRPWPVIVIIAVQALVAALALFVGPETRNRDINA
ncbi:MAG: MFS transporter, partial [Parafilimonas terrae]|nr:MFS transporter [Parafilimonas terrae]